MLALSILKNAGLIGFIVIFETLALRATVSHVPTRKAAWNRCVYVFLGGVALFVGFSELDGYAQVSAALPLLPLAIAVIGGGQMLFSLIQYTIFLTRHSI